MHPTLNTHSDITALPSVKLKIAQDSGLTNPNPNPNPYPNPNPSPSPDPIPSPDPNPNPNPNPKIAQDSGLARPALIRFGRLKPDPEAEAEAAAEAEMEAARVTRFARRKL